MSSLSDTPFNLNETEHILLWLVNEIYRYVEEKYGVVRAFLQYLSVFYPGWLWKPLLWLLGFTPLGPLAGSWAAWFQTANTAAGGLFAIFQSAGMGGYGAAILNHIVRALGVIVALVNKYGREVVRLSEEAMRELYECLKVLMEFVNMCFWPEANVTSEGFKM